jgi:hypothetical protein
VFATDDAKQQSTCQVQRNKFKELIPLNKLKLDFLLLALHLLHLSKEISFVTKKPTLYVTTNLRILSLTIQPPQKIPTLIISPNTFKRQGSPLPLPVSKKLTRPLSDLRSYPSSSLYHLTPHLGFHVECHSAHNQRQKRRSGSHASLWDQDLGGRVVGQFSPYG